jgi:hypothetical protein
MNQLAKALLLSVLLAAGSAYSHDAPSGWAYPWSCCSNQDCHEVPEAAIKEGLTGYELVTTGEIIPYGDKRIKDSPDGHFHACQQSGDFDKGHVLCLFVPSRGA